MPTQTTHDFALSATVFVETPSVAGTPSSKRSVDMFAGALTFSDEGTLLVGANHNAAIDGVGSGRPEGQS